MTVGASRAELTITRQPALAPSPQPRPAPTARALVAPDVRRRGPFWRPIRGPDWAPIDTGDISMTRAEKVWDIRRRCIRGNEGVLWDDHGNVLKRIIRREGEVQGI